MKLSEHHQRDLLQIMCDYGLTWKDFELVKRKGRINIIYAPGQSFAYIRISSGKRKDFFKVSQNGGKEMEVPDWNDVISFLRKWLKELRSKVEKVVPTEIEPASKV